MSRIIVSSLSLAQGVIDSYGVSRVISLLGPESPHRTFSGIHPDEHLKLTFHDIAAPMPDFIAPTEDTVSWVLDFIHDWPRDKPMLIHCWAGISRSTASAYMAQCLTRPDKDELELAVELRAASPTATPNPLMIAYADALMQRNGRMTRAIQAIGRGAEAFEGTPFSLQAGPA